MSNAVVKNTVGQFSSFLDKLKPQLALACPKHMNSDRMARLALTAFSTSPKLQECAQQSIAASIMTAAQLGLEPGVNGAGFLIPYGKTCTFVPGWKGLVDLVSRSGRGTVYTGVIFNDQDYTFTDGARRDLIIHNQTDLDDPNAITHAYAIGWVRDAAMPIIELWSVAKICKHRDKYNKVGNKHYSFRDWEMYCRKVPLLQVLKYMPCSIELSNAIDVSHAAESGRGVTIENGIVIDMDAVDEPQQSASVTPQSIMRGKKAEPKPVVEPIANEPSGELDKERYDNLSDILHVIKSAQTEEGLSEISNSFIVEHVKLYPDDKPELTAAYKAAQMLIKNNKKD